MERARKRYPNTRQYLGVGFDTYEIYKEETPANFTKQENEVKTNLEEVFKNLKFSECTTLPKTI